MEDLLQGLVPRVHDFFKKLNPSALGSSYEHGDGKATRSADGILRAYGRGEANAAAVVARADGLPSSGETRTHRAWVRSGPHLHRRGARAKTSIQTVSKWRQRFVDRRLDGMADTPHP